MTDKSTTDELCAMVKPLEWEPHPMGWIAALPTGHAYIIDIRIKDRVMFIKGMSPPPQVSSVDAAKSAAQADYEARILSAVTLRSAAEVRAEALREVKARIECLISAADDAGLQDRKDGLRDARDAILGMIGGAE